MRCVSYLRRNHKVMSSHIRANVQAQGLTPVQVAAAYGMKLPAGKSVVKPCKIGIVSLGGIANSSDVTTTFQSYGLPAPIIDLIPLGGSPTSDPGGANVENMLDLELAAAAYAFATGQPANLIFCESPNTGTGIADAINALVANGCGVISISWGAPETQWAPGDRAATEQALNDAVTKGCTVFVASGDNSVDDGTNAPTCDYPCGSAYAWAVGGTNLSLAQDGTRAAERAWGDGLPGDEGGGGGFDPATSKPPWQGTAFPGQFRGCPDSSANADPNSGYQIVSDGQWQVVGGTSASTPLTAGYIAALKAAGATFGPLGPIVYPQAGTCFNDITTGSNGAPAAAGWDAATGLGSPNGAGLAAALLGAINPTPPPVCPAGQVWDPVTKQCVPIQQPPPPPPPTGTIRKGFDAAIQYAEAHTTNRAILRMLIFVGHYVDAILPPNL